MYSQDTNGQTSNEVLANVLFARYASAREEGNSDDSMWHRHNAVMAALVLADERGQRAWAPILDEAMTEIGSPTNFTDMDTASKRRMARVASFSVGLLFQGTCPEDCLRKLISEE